MRHGRPGRGKRKIVTKTQEEYEATKCRAVPNLLAVIPWLSCCSSVDLSFSVRFSFCKEGVSDMLILVLDEGVAVAMMTAQVKKKKLQGGKLGCWSQV